MATTNLSESVFSNKQVRVALYGRVSTTNHGQNVSLQTRELEQFAQARGWRLVDSYLDIGISGSKDKRPELDRLMAEDFLNQSVKMCAVRAGLRKLGSCLTLALSVFHCLIGHDKEKPFTTPRQSWSASSYPSSNFMYMDSFMRWIVFGPKFNSVRDFDYDKNPDSLIPFEKDQDADSTVLSGFKAHGGKLILYNGWADHSTPPLRTVKYYNDVRQNNGDSIDEFVRLFMMPGLYHCTGGPGPNTFGGLGQKGYKKNDPENDIIGALDRWVDQGIAPTKLIATKFKDDDPRQGVARTRPVCPYPQVATYKGSGSVDAAANFVCASSK